MKAFKFDMGNVGKYLLQPGSTNIRNRGSIRNNQSKKKIMKKLTLLFLLMLFFVIACGDDGPTGPTVPSKEGAVLISASGSSTEFDTFKFGVVPFFDWLIISSVKGTDTLLVTLFDYQSKEVNSAISLTDTSLLIIGTFGSGKFAAINLSIGSTVSGSITFTSLDTSGSIAATFSSGATLTTFNIATEQISTAATIAGNFVATKAAEAAVAASIVRYKRISRPIK